MPEQVPNHMPEVLDSSSEAVEKEIGSIAVENVYSSDAEQEYSLSALEEARKAGVDEERLKHLVTLVGMRNTPRDQMHVLQTIIGRDNLPVAADELLRVTRDYQKELTRSREKGLLLHYHQTGMDNLESIVNEGALISHDERKERGAELNTSGARPDVVQMTRDRYDSSGKLVEAGLKGTSGHLIAGGDLAFVFKESVMDEPGYDSIDKYPNLPSVPLDKLVAVVVNNNGNIKYVQEMLAKKGINARVVLRSQWLDGYK
jgi:hypothetical protein